MQNQKSWANLIYLGLQAAGAASILSATLASGLRKALMTPVQPGWEVQFGAALWFGLSLLCLTPILLAVTQRWLNRNAYTPEQAWAWREAAVLSLASVPTWWCAPALFWS